MHSYTMHEGQTQLSCRLHHPPPLPPQAGPSKSPIWHARSQSVPWNGASQGTEVDSENTASEGLTWHSFLSGPALSLQAGGQERGCWGAWDLGHLDWREIAPRGKRVAGSGPVRPISAPHRPSLRGTIALASQTRQELYPRERR